jgi:toxin YoeB
MNLVFAPQAWGDYLYWQATDKKVIRRINELLKDTIRSPFDGIGKPEPLKHAYSGYWSRRIDSEHRFVYRVTDDDLWIAQLRLHY